MILYSQINNPNIGGGGGESSTLQKARVYFDGSQTIPKLYPSKMSLNNVSYDENSLWDAANNKMCIKEAGKYLVTAAWRVANPAVSNWLSVFIVKNGTDNILESCTGVAGSSCSPGITDIVNLNEGDTLELYVVYFSTTNGVTYGGSNGNFLSICRLSD